MAVAVIGKIGFSYFGDRVLCNSFKFSVHIAKKIHTSVSYFSAVQKSALAKLRKKTGYSFHNCKKALELHEQDLDKAENWLKEQAKTLGWEKSLKLEGRPTSQGGVAVRVEKNTATILELNCETDFVARNKLFISMLDSSSKTLQKYAASLQSEENFQKIKLNPEKIKSLVNDDGMPLSDQLALLIGNVGENVTFSRAVCIKSMDNVKLGGCVHPVSDSNKFIGKFGALVTFQASGNPKEKEVNLSHVPLNEIGKQLCQHIIGMNPDKIGVSGEDEPADNIDEENVMIYQEYLLDPSITVEQFLVASGITVLDFVRFECGESLNE